MSGWLGLAGRRAIVTGGGSGIGRATVAALARQAGCEVFVCDRDEAALADTLALFDGLPVHGRHLDVSDAASVDKVIGSIGRADVLCNCAGITKDSWLLRMEEKSWDQVMGVNLKGTFLMTQAFAREVAKDLGGEPPSPSQASPGDGGSVINIASIVGKIGNLGQANYSASKAGVVGFTKTAAKELAAYNVRVNAVLPGFINTPMAQAVPEKVLKMIIPAVPQKRMGEPEEIADAVVYLASPRSSYLTGGVLEVAGGFSM